MTIIRELFFCNATAYAIEETIEALAQFSHHYYVDEAIRVLRNFQFTGRMDDFIVDPDPNASGLLVERDSWFYYYGVECEIVADPVGINDVGSLPTYIVPDDLSELSGQTANTDSEQAILAAAAAALVELSRRSPTSVIQLWEPYNDYMNDTD